MNEDIPLSFQGDRWKVFSVKLVAQDGAQYLGEPYHVKKDAFVAIDAQNLSCKFTKIPTEFNRRKGRLSIYTSKPIFRKTYFHIRQKSYETNLN